MPILAFFLLLLCYLLTGYGILHLFEMRLKAAYTLTLSLLLGIAVASFLPFLLQLFYVAITPAAVFGSLLLTGLLVNLPLLDSIRKEGFSAFRRTLPRVSFRVRPYEMPYWVIIGFLIFVSVWRCYYLPPFSRDALSGPEAIAEFAVREHSLINSFFSVDLWSTNNQFKSPFLISLQLIYKMAGFPFGQIWLSIVFISFTVFLYHALREKLHPILAGLLLLLFILTPEMYAYTFMILYDYSNMVFFFLSLYFLFGSISATDGMAGSAADRTKAHFYFAGLLMGIATYIRSETLFFALLFLPYILLAQRRQKMPVKNMTMASGLFFLPSFLGYYLPSQLYIKYYLPVHYDIGGLVNDHLSTLGSLFGRYGEIVTRLMSGEFSVHLWGYFFFFTTILFLAELIFVRRFNKDARNWLYAIVVFYLGLGALSWLLPLMTLNETTKRALFKMLPLALFYLANNELLLRLSRSISRWENSPSGSHLFGPSAEKATPAKAAPAKAVLTRTGKTIATAAPPSKPQNTPPAGGAKKRRK